ncbi:hypothetical protein Tco_0391903, partial [Tanacetum coccineum]
YLFLKSTWELCEANHPYACDLKPVLVRVRSDGGQESASHRGSGVGDGIGGGGDVDVGIGGGVDVDVGIGGGVGVGIGGGVSDGIGGGGDVDVGIDGGVGDGWD